MISNTSLHTLTHTHVGGQHVPIGPLTPEQENLAKIAFYQSSQHGHSLSEEQPQITMGLSGAVQRHSSSSHIKAFSGKGHTLSSSGSGQSAVASGGGGGGGAWAEPSRPGRGRGSDRVAVGGGGRGVSRLVQETAAPSREEPQTLDQV